ncbi:MAG: hypothetical protein GF408_04550 [Candidatus Omnitrophica bacterium]|nr:hypothetical protein [Candidatus Omnitrophota bacterium]
MRLFDENFRKNKMNYFGQTLLGGVAVSIALMLFDVVRNPVIIASFGASGLVAFAMPEKKISGPRYLIGGYAIGVLAGSLLHYLTTFPIHDYLTLKALHLIVGAFTVALAMFLMAVTNTEHAPATSIALGLVVNDWTPMITVKIMAGIIIISLLKAAFQRKMIDLV